MRLPRLSGASRRLFILLFCSLITPNLAAEPKFTVTQFGNQLTPFQFFEDSEHVLITDPQSGTVNISFDAGAKWEPIEDVPEDHALQVFLSPASNKVAVIIGRKLKHWITKDQGKTWASFKTELPPISPMPISFHATDPSKIILNTGVERDREVIYTTDHFKTQHHLHERAVQCMWAKEKEQFTTGDDKTDDTRVLCITNGPSSRDAHAQRLYVSDNYFKGKEEIWPDMEDGRPIDGIVSMVEATKYILAARRSERTNEMAMYSSQDGKTWHRALFGQQRLEADGFTVMEGTNHSVQVDVMHGGSGIFRPAPMGKLYTSNSNGTSFTQTQPYTNRNDIGFSDFEKVEGIEGVALINIVDNPEEVLNMDAYKKIVSRITFDDGRTFQALKAGKENLHLHSYTELRNQGKVFSSKAPGILLGVGNTGKERGSYDEGDLWVSNDGGENWHKSLTGPFKYEFGDAGALLFAVNDEAPTNKVRYSLKHGKEESWEEFKIPSDKLESFRPGWLTTVPDSTSKKFVMTAMTGRGQDLKQWVLSFDFNPLDVGKCKEKDFEEWYARKPNEKEDPQCIMGHTQWFRRRKADSVCFVDEKFKEPLPKTDNCECTAEDYECDYGFIREQNSTSCEPAGRLTPPEGSCQSKNSTYEGSSGFRLIPGNTCIKPKKDKARDALITRPCNETHGSSPVGNGKISHEITEFPTTEILDYYYLERDENEQEPVVMIDINNRLWTSDDHGKTWNKRDLEKEIIGIRPNRYKKERVYFLTPSKTVYYSPDWGKTIKEIQAPGPPNTAHLPIIQFHETQDDWLIWTTCSDFGPMTCDPQSFVSRKGGKVWDPLVADTGNCEFVYNQARNGTEKRVFCAQHYGDKRKRLLSSDDWMETKDPIYEDIVRYATMSEFILVATREEDKEGSTLKVDASIDSKTFAPAKFPPRVRVTSHDSYTALDSSTNAIFLHATTNGNLGQEYGSIIKSNSNGTNFVLSLENVNRNSKGYVDFEKILGVEGAAVANVISNVKEVTQGASKKRKTMITHNDGADWDYIKPPIEDSEGRAYLCKDGNPVKNQNTEDCSLHLHGYTERKDPGDTYSSPTAIGMMIGIGNVGEHLGEVSDGDTFVSSDGGITWRTAMQGQFMWEFGDQGSVIVLVQGDAPTDRVFYSIDEGNSWKEKHFGSEIEVNDITTVPSDNSRNFLLWGRTTGSKIKAATVNLDFSGIYDRACKLNQNDEESKDSDNDYELWTPEHPKTSGKTKNCVFGHEAQYWRKKTDRNCYNGPMVDKLSSIKRNCLCTAYDFEWYVQLPF